MALVRFSIPFAILVVLIGTASPAGAGSLRFGSNTIFLPGTGTPTENGIALAEVVAEVNVSMPSDARWTIELGPGVFDLGTAGVSLDRRIALTGAGQSVSTITCACEEPVIEVAADRVEIRDLRLDNTSTNDTLATGIATFGFDFLYLRDVHVATAGDDGIDISSADGTVIEGVTVEAADAAVDFNDAVATASIRNSRLVSAGFDVVQATVGVITIEGSTLEAESSSPVLRLFTEPVVVVRHSSLIPNGGPYARSTSGTLEMTQTYVSSGAMADLTGTATGTCSATSGDGTFSATTCP